METLLFAFGTFQLEKVQMRLFGRLPEADGDMLPGYAATTVMIADPEILSTSGSATHLAAVRSKDPSAALPGKVLRITEADLAAIDPFQGEHHRRTQVRLASGRAAWAYVKA